MGEIAHIDWSAAIERCEPLDGIVEQIRVAAQASQGVTSVVLVGGVVRDLALAERDGLPLAVNDVDVAVEGDSLEVAAALARPTGASVREHQAFGTATVDLGGVRVDLARTRVERYPEPGALPVVEPATLAEDLRRRDFTINAVAVQIWPVRAHAAIDPFHGVRDLHQQRISVLHDGSFIDDPTRLWRAARYAARLGMQLDEKTDRIAREAVASQALETVSAQRLQTEVRLLLSETRLEEGVELASSLGLLAALGFEAEQIARLPLESPADGELWVERLGALLQPRSKDEVERIVTRLALSRRQRRQLERDLTR